MFPYSHVGLIPSVYPQTVVFANAGQLQLPEISSSNSNILSNKHGREISQSPLTNLKFKGHYRASITAFRI